jgi:hypothetical protein
LINCKQLSLCTNQKKNLQQLLHTEATAVAGYCHGMDADSPVHFGHVPILAAFLSWFLTLYDVLRLLPSALRPLLVDGRMEHKVGGYVGFAKLKHPMPVDRSTILSLVYAFEFCVGAAAGALELDSR